MKTEVKDIQETVIQLLKKQLPILKITAENESKFEVAGTIEAMQGKKKVNGHYFATVMPKPKDCRFYFFPTYTHRDQLVETMSDDLKKCLKGKSCFHIKKMSEEMETELDELIEKAVGLYQKDGLLKS